MVKWRKVVIRSCLECVVTRDGHFSHTPVSTALDCCLHFLHLASADSSRIYISPTELVPFCFQLSIWRRPVIATFRISSKFSIDDSLFKSFPGLPTEAFERVVLLLDFFRAWHFSNQSFRIQCNLWIHVFKILVTWQEVAYAGKQGQCDDGSIGSFKYE